MQHCHVLFATTCALYFQVLLGSLYSKERLYVCCEQGAALLERGYVGGSQIVSAASDLALPCIAGQYPTPFQREVTFTTEHLRNGTREKLAPLFVFKTRTTSGGVQQFG